MITTISIINVYTLLCGFLLLNIMSVRFIHTFVCFGSPLLILLYSNSFYE